jgi:integrase
VTRLTVNRISSIKPDAAAKEYRDGHVANLYLAVRPSGVRSWNFRYRVAGKARKLTIGRWPAITVDAARKLAQQAAAKVAGGADPHQEKKAARRREVAEKAPVKDRVEKVCAAYLKHAAARTRASTAAVTSRILKVYVLPGWKGRRLSEITKADVRLLIADIAARAPIMANRVLTSLKTMCNWAVEQDVISVSPCAGLKPPAAEVSRDRVLADHELGQVWRACDGLGRSVDWMGNEVTRPYGAVVRLLALTGQRLREVSEMRWSELDLDARTWSLPRERCKNGHAHVVMLSEQAIAILKALKPPVSVDLVFGVSGFSRAKKALDAVAKLSTPWTLHDLRRTCASGMARLGVPPHVVEAVLNHKSGQVRGVAAVYNRYSYSTEKREALALWAAHVERCASNIIIARPVEISSDISDAVGELEAA